MDKKREKPKQKSMGSYGRIPWVSGASALSVVSRTFRRLRDRKGFGLTWDAIISLIFIFLVSSAISPMFFTESTDSTTLAIIKLHHLSEDVLESLNEKGVLDTIGEEWTSGNATNASEIASSYLDVMLPQDVGYRLTFDDETVVQNTRNPLSSAIAATSARRLLAGYTINQTVLGSVSRAFLTGIRSKTSSAYAYFGGFVGQGNLTRYMYVPSGVTITDAYMEMDAGSSFNMYVNGQACQNPHSPSGGYLSADIEENLTSCAFTTGKNTIDIDFTGGILEDEFIGGGFIRVTYNTSLLNESSETGSGTFEFPGIYGMINYYSSFYVPGTLNSMGIHLVFNNNYTTFLKIGDVLVYNSTGNSSTQTVDLDNSYLQSKLNYNLLSDNTVPIRLGTSNISEIVQEGVADVILITDLSGSMRWRIGYDDSVSGQVRDCSDPHLYDNDTRRISLAKCLDKQFVNKILNQSGNRVGLVGFSSSAYTYHSLSADNNSLISDIDGYSDSPSGGTCICCAINRAYDILNSESSPEKNKFIIVMSDGITGYCCGRTGWWWWASCNSQGTSTSGRYTDCSGGSSDCTGGQCDGAIDNAIWSAQRTHDDLDTTLNSVGFGPVEDCQNGNYTMRQIASVGNGTYCASTDPVDLQNCYVNFAEDILQASVRSQVLNLTGSTSPSVLYPSSYISYNFTPLVPQIGYGEISFSYDTERFNDNTTCNGHLYIPASATVIDSKITSYSSEHWTHYVSVTNSGGVRTAYRLSDYGTEYYTLGDPYIVSVDPTDINSGENNTFYIMTGDSPTNDTGCSLDNRAIVTVKVSGSVGFGDVFSTSEGCNWSIEFEDGSMLNTQIPSSYSGSASCIYSAANITYADDAMADAVYRMLKRLDMDSNGRIDIKFDSSQVAFDLSDIGDVRSLWGPAKLILMVWK